MVWLWGRKGAQVGLLVYLAPKCNGKSPKPPRASGPRRCALRFCGRTHQKASAAAGVLYAPTAGHWLRG